MSDSDWIELDRHTREIHRSALSFAQISAAGPPPEQWHRRLKDHSLLHMFYVINHDRSDIFARLTMAAPSVACGAFAVYAAKWMLANLPSAVLCILAVILTLAGDVVPIFHFVNPAFSADCLENRIVWGASFCLLKDALWYLPESLKSYEALSPFSVTMLISSLWNVDKGDYRNKLLAWECNESANRLTADRIENTVAHFVEHHVQMSVGVGILLASNGAIAVKALIGTIATARLMTASGEDMELEMKTRQKIRQETTKTWRNDLPPLAALKTAECCAQISASGPPPEAWYLRWKDHTLLHILRRFPNDRSLMVNRSTFVLSAASAFFFFHVIKLICSKMITYLPITMLCIIAATSILLVTEMPLINTTPVFGCYRLENRLCWATFFIATRDVLELLPESLTSFSMNASSSGDTSTFQFFPVVMFISGVWNFDRGDYYCKKLSWECIIQKRLRRTNQDETIEILNEFMDYNFMIFAGVGIMLASCGLVPFSAALVGFLVLNIYFISPM